MIHARTAVAALLSGAFLLLPPDSLAAQEHLYAAIQGEASVAVVDMATLEVVRTVDLRALGFSESAKPHHVAVEADGSFWYLSLIGENRVLKFDRDDNLVGQAEFEVPGMLALDPVNDRLYVGRSMSAVNPPQRIGILQRSSMEIDEIEVLFPRPHALATHPTAGVVYSASLGVNRMAAVDGDSWDVALVDIDGPTHALVQFAVSPDGGTLVATAELTGELLVFDLTDPRAPAFVRSIPVGPRPWHPIYGRDGRHVYFGTKGDDGVVEVDVAAGRVARRFQVPGADQPHGSAVSPDGRLLFVTNNGPGGMGMGGMGQGDHAAMDHAAMDHGVADRGDPGGPRYETGTLAVIDLDRGDLVTVIPLGINVTGVGAPGR